MKKFLSVFALAALVLAAAACGSKKENVVKIGLVSPMTGAGAAVVDYWVNGFNMAVEELNAKNQGTKYEIVFEDCQSDPATAVSCYKRLEMQGIKYIIGFGGQFAMAIAPMTKGKDVMYFTVMDYNETVLDVTDCAFRVYPSAKALGDIAANYLVDSCGLKDFATITLNTVPCLQATQAFCDNISGKEGASVNFQDKYDIGSFDFKNTVNRMSEKKINGIFINGFGNSPASFANQMSYVKKFDGITMFGDVNLSTASFAANNKNDKITVYYADADIKDEFLQKYVPGMFDNTYMITSQFITPGVKFLKYHDLDFAETRGLWEVYNDFMGGPFVSHSFYSKDGKDIIVLEAWVYAAKYDKRQYLRQVESLLYSFEWDKE